MAYLVTAPVMLTVSAVVHYSLYLVAGVLIPQWYLSEYFEDEYRRELDDKPEYCAKQRSECECNGTVFYGAKLSDGHLDTGKPYNQLDVQGAIKCDDSIFGDPIPYNSKYCFCQVAGQ